MSFAGSPSRPIRKSLSFLQENWHKPIKLTDVIKASTLSRRGFQKAFQKHIGHSPGRELRRIRIERSKVLLAICDLRLNVVAQMCGYRSLNSFWVAFRQSTGLSPGRYRARFQRA
jgi:transcriptional regulator GlxA family with amidase domain